MIAILYAFAEGTFYNWAVIYLQETKRLPMAVAAAALSVFWAAMVAGRLTVSIAVLRLPAERIWLVLPVLMICAFLALPYANTPALGIGLFALAGLACSAFFPLTIGLISRRFEQHVAWVSSMIIAALMVGVGLGAFVIGLLRSQLALEQLYRFSSLYPMLVLVLVLAVTLIRNRAPDRPRRHRLFPRDDVGKSLFEARRPGASGGSCIGEDRPFGGPDREVQALAMYVGAELKKVPVAERADPAVHVKQFNPAQEFQ